MAENKKYISQLYIGQELYDIKDAEARAQIELLATGGVRYVGKTETLLTDGGVQIPVIEGKDSYAPLQGDLVIYTNGDEPDIEFIWNGQSWDMFGNHGELGDFAYVDKGEANLDWQHNHVVNFEDATVNVSGATSGVAVGDHTYTPAGNVAIGDGAANYTPAGTVTLGGQTAKAVTLSGEVADETIPAHSYKPEGSVEITVKAPGADETANLVPAGTIGDLTFTGTQATLNHSAHDHELTGEVSVKNTHNLTANGAAVDAHDVNVTGASYTPAGSVTISGTVGNVQSENDSFVYDGSVAKTIDYNAVKASVSGEILTLSEADLGLEFNPSFKTALTSVSYEQPEYSATFSGTAATITPVVAIADHVVTNPTISGTVTSTVTNTLAVEAATVGAHTYTPAGSISKPVFTGAGMLIKAAFAGKQASLEHGAHNHGLGTLAGTVQVPTTAAFAGTGVNLVFNGVQATLKHTVTQGTVSASGTYKKVKDLAQAGQNATLIVLPKQ